jgi:hypothetical protein
MCRGQRLMPEDERQPLSGAIIMEFGNIERAGIQQGHVCGAIGGIVTLGTDKLVDVLKVLIIAAIDDHMTALAEHHGRCFMLKAAKRRPLSRHRRCVVWVHLNDPAEAQRLVRLLSPGKAVVVSSPAIAVPGAIAVVNGT